MTDMTINLAPDPSVYSPHVRRLKWFFEELTKLIYDAQIADEQDDDSVDADAAIAAFAQSELDEMRKAMSDVLTDDFMLIVDGKRLPGAARHDK